MWIIGHVTGMVLVYMHPSSEGVTLRHSIEWSCVSLAQVFGIRIIMLLYNSAVCYFRLNVVDGGERKSEQWRSNFEISSSLWQFRLPTRTGLQPCNHGDNRNSVEGKSSFPKILLPLLRSHPTSVHSVWWLSWLHGIKDEEGGTGRMAHHPSTLIFISGVLESEFCSDSTPRCSSVPFVCVCRAHRLQLYAIQLFYSTQDSIVHLPSPTLSNSMLTPSARGTISACITSLRSTRTYKYMI